MTAWQLAAMTTMISRRSIGEHMSTGTAAPANLTTSVINPLIQATFETFEMMLDCKSRRTRLSLKDDTTQLYPITAVIGMTGQAAGSICLSFSREAACTAVKRMLDMDVDEITPLVCDTVGEFANVIAGSAKDRLADLSLELGIPNIIRGQNVQIDFPSNAQPLVIQFESDIGPFLIICGFVNR